MSAQVVELDLETGVYTRGAFERELAFAVQVARRAAQPCSLLVVDVDDFQALRDVRGDLAADSCVEALAERISSESSGAGPIGRLGADTFALSASGMPANVSLLFFQGTQAQSGGLGAVFGDGLRCASGSVVRIATTLADGSGASSYPQGGDPSVSVRGLVAAPGTRTYQVWYRNAAAFCTSDTFNLTNGVSVLWGS